MCGHIFTALNGAACSLASRCSYQDMHLAQARIRVRHAYQHQQLSYCTAETYCRQCYKTRFRLLRLCCGVPYARYVSGPCYSACNPLYSLDSAQLFPKLCSASRHQQGAAAGSVIQTACLKLAWMQACVAYVPA